MKYINGFRFTGTTRQASQCICNIAMGNNVYYGVVEFGSSWEFPSIKLYWQNRQHITMNNGNLAYANVMQPSSIAYF